MQIVSILFTCLTVVHALPAPYGGTSTLTATETREIQNPLQIETEQHAIKSQGEEEEEEELEDAVHEELLNFEVMKELELDGEENPDASSVTNQRRVQMERRVEAPKARKSWFAWWW